jgi:hypothetical protein
MAEDTARRIGGRGAVPAPYLARIVVYLVALLGLLSGAPNDIRAEPVEELSDLV